MTAIRIEHRKPPPEAPADAAPPEWKWDRLPVLKEVVEAESDAPQDEARPHPVSAP